MKVDGAKIRRLRENMGLTAKDLANRASISPSHLSLVESGKRDVGPHVAVRLASALDIAIVDLRSSSEAVSPNPRIR